MKRARVLLIAIVSVAVVGTIVGIAADEKTSAETAAQVGRGKYLVTVAACSDCHTPFKMGANGPEPDMTRYLSGHPDTVKLPPPPKLSKEWNSVFAASNTAFAGPWGISYAANLTPDPSGLVAWTEDIFVKAMKSGKHWGTSRPIMPPMPWPSYAQMTDEDLKAIFAYLRSIPPVKNHVPDYQPPVEKEK